MKVYSPYRGGRFRISSPYGWRTILGAREWHKGLDLVGANGDTAVCAAVGGTVLQSRIVVSHDDLTWQWGNYVSIRGDDGNTIYYCHLASRAVERGQTVRAGDLLGVQGHSGYSFGDHLQFEVRNSSNKDINAATYLGIQNVACSGNYMLPTAAPDYAALVCSKCGLEEQTKVYINKYKYADDLWRKLYEQMK